MQGTARETIRFRKKTEKKRLNKRAVEALTLPPPKEDGRPAQRWYYDSETPRLAICAWTTGAKTWYWIGRVDNGTRMIRHKLGEFPEMTTEQAKKKAAATSADVANGIDPQKEKRNAREELTLQDAFDRYYKEHAEKHKRRPQDDADQFRWYCGAIKNRKLSSIDAGAIAALHTKVGEENGKYSANRVLALLSKLFAFCKMPVSRIGYRGDNPCKGIQKYPEQKRERFMDADEIGRFLAALQQEDQQTQDFFMVLLLTGARRGNVMSMEWTELELGKATWRISAAKFKTNKPQTVHLPADAVAILERRKAESKSEWVFPSVRHNKAGRIGHIEAPKFTWTRICKRAKLADLRMHDLRRTMGSWMTAMGASLPMTGKALGHQNQATTAIYARLDINPVRAWVDTAAAAMMATNNGKKVGDQNETEA